MYTFAVLDHHPKYLINLVGPTASGKTALAIALARFFQTEIISSDCRQFYAELNIGTAKPNDTELLAAPHHFIGHKSVTENYSAGDFGRDALQKLKELYRSHQVIIMVGGSGLYIKAVTEGFDPLPPANEELRNELHQQLSEKGLPFLQQRLKLLNETAYQKTALDNPQRVMRAIEIETGKLTQPSKETSQLSRDFKIIQIGIDLPRDLLYQRINKRVDAMLAQGLEAEAKRMEAYRTTYALRTVGYKELFDYFDGLYSLENAIQLIKQHTRNYAKRQMTWFRRNPNIKWFNSNHPEPVISYLKEQIVL